MYIALTVKQAASFSNCEDLLNTVHVLQEWRTSVCIIVFT